MSEQADLWAIRKAAQRASAESIIAAVAAEMSLSERTIRQTIDNHNLIAAPPRNMYRAPAPKPEATQPLAHPWRNCPTKAVPVTDQPFEHRRIEPEPTPAQAAARDELLNDIVAERPQTLYIVCGDPATRPGDLCVGCSDVVGNGASLAPLNELSNASKPLLFVKQTTGSRTSASASAVAFLASEVADLAVYDPLRRRHWLGAVTASNAVGLVVDSALFLWLAFGSLEFLWGQVVAKGYMTILAVVALWLIRQRTESVVWSRP